MRFLKNLVAFVLFLSPALLKIAASMLNLCFRLSLLFLGFSLASCSQAQNRKTPATPNGPAQAEWSVKQIDLGQIPFGVPVTSEFTVKNTGGDTLLIHNAKVTCHCLSTDWTREPIPSGRTGAVRVTFDAAKEGEFYRIVPVITSADGDEAPVALVVKGVVLPKPATDGN